MKSVATHNGKFHADDVFSIGILKLIYPNLQIIRTRDPKKLKNVDARVDVGLKYNHETLDYDHHQIEFIETRPNKIPYASTGLIWRHYGEKLTNSKEVWQVIEEKIIQYIDADDNGIRTHEAKKIEPYTLREIIDAFNPGWPDKKEDRFDKNFDEAVSTAMKIIEKELESAEGIMKASVIIKKKISENNKEYLILNENMPFQDTVRKESKKIKFVVKGDPSNNQWATIGVKKELNSFEIRKQLPKKWAGLSGEALQKVTGVKDAVFCTKKLYVAVAKSKEGAIKLAELALKD